MPRPLPDDDAPPARPSDAAVRLALHRLIDALDAEAAWVLLRWLEAWRLPPAPWEERESRH